MERLSLVFRGYWFSLPEKGDNFFNENAFKLKRKQNLKREKENQRSNAIFQLAAHVLDLNHTHEIEMGIVNPGKKSLHRNRESQWTGLISYNGLMYIIFVYIIYI